MQEISVNIPQVVIIPSDEIGQQEQHSPSLSELSDDTRYELTQWAIHELIEQNNENESQNKKQKAIIAALGTATTVLSLTLVISEIIKTWT